MRRSRSTEELQRSVALKMIYMDANFVGRFIRAATRNSDVSGTLLNCMAPYLSLMAYESSRALEKLGVANAATITRHTDILKRSRHSTKLFEDSKRRLHGQLTYFDELIAVHSAHFLGNAPRQFSYLERDLGLSSYRSRLILTTHGANFANGVTPQEVLAESNHSLLRDVGMQLGEYFGSLGAVLDERRDGLTSELDPSSFGEPEDVRSQYYYASVFNGAGTLSLNAMLSMFQATLNFAFVAFRELPRTPPFHSRTITKLRFLALYSVVSSLRMLSRDGQVELNARSKRRLDAILDCRTSRAMMEPSMRDIRNDFVHYRSRSPLLGVVDTDDPYDAVVRAAGGGFDIIALDRLLTAGLGLSSAAMNAWAADGVE